MTREKLKEFNVKHEGLDYVTTQTSILSGECMEIGCVDDCEEMWEGDQVVAVMNFRATEGTTEFSLDVVNEITFDVPEGTLILVDGAPYDGELIDGGSNVKVILPTKAEEV